MALEDLTGADKFISNLIPANPVGSDDKRDGDNHIRGIKNVLRNTFPNLNGAVTATDEDMSSISGKVNRAGDTMTGPLSLPRLGIGGPPGAPYAIVTLSGPGVAASPVNISEVKESSFFVEGGRAGAGGFGGLIYTSSGGGGAAILGSRGAGIETQWTFYTNGPTPGSLVPHMAIDTAGQLNINVSGPARALVLRNDSNGLGVNWSFGPKAGNACALINNDLVGVEVLQGATAWSAASDERLKTGLVHIDRALEKVATLRAVTGQYKTDEAGVSRAFLIAQDVQAVLPQAVGERDDGMLMLAYTDVIPLLVAAIQDLRRELMTVRELAGV